MMTGLMGSRNMPAAAFGLLLSLVLVACLTLPAGAQPPLPTDIRFWGSVSLYGGAPPQGTEVSAWITGVKVAGCQVDGSGRYGVYPDELAVPCNAGKTVVFYVGSQAGGSHLIQGDDCSGAIEKNLVVTAPTSTPEPTETPAPSATPGGGNGGGNGGGAPPTDTPAPTATQAPTATTVPYDIDLSGAISGDGVVQRDILYSDPDGMMAVHIASGTVAQNDSGEPLPGIEVEMLCFGYPQPSEGAYIIGCAYDLGPEGATFEPPITLTLKYDLGLIAANVTEAGLAVAFFDTSAGKWVGLPSDVDTVNDTVTVEVGHLTVFAVYSYAAAASTGTPAVTATAAPSPTNTATPVPEQEEGTANTGVIIGIIIAIIVVGFIAYLFLRGR